MASRTTSGGISYSTGRLRAVFPRADREVDLGEDEIHRLIHQVEDRSFVNLIGRESACGLRCRGNGRT